jgi:hypothetical protein
MVGTSAAETKHGSTLANESAEKNKVGFMAVKTYDPEMDFHCL